MIYLCFLIQYVVEFQNILVFESVGGQAKKEAKMSIFGKQLHLKGLEWLLLIFRPSQGSPIFPGLSQIMQAQERRQTDSADDSEF